MKKALSTLLTLGLVLSLTACGAQNEPAVSDSTSTPASVSVSKTSTESSASEDPSAVSEPTGATVESVIANFKAAQECWFKFEGAASTDYEDEKIGQIGGYDAQFFRVKEPGMGTYNELVEYLSQYVNPDFAKAAVDNSEMYMESDGVMYMAPAGRGDDLSMAWVEFAVDLQGPSGTLTLTIHRQDYLDILDDWYETGARTVMEFPFVVEAGEAIFDKMEYVCGPAPQEASVEGHDPDSLEAILISFLVGNWIYTDGTSSYSINEDGSFVEYIDGEEAKSGIIFSSRSDDGSYMMKGEDFNNTLFYLSSNDEGTPVLLFDEGAIVFTKE